MSDFHLAQINVAEMLYPRDSAELKPFMDDLSRINALAEASPGFVWRLKDDSGNATSLITSLGPNVLINISVWADIESLQAFTYKSAHRDVLRRRTEWFEASSLSHMAMWWVPAGSEPTMEDGVGRLQYLRMHGSSDRAFTFSSGVKKPSAK